MVSFAVILWNVMQHSPLKFLFGGALHDIPNNGCKRDHISPVTNLKGKSTTLILPCLSVKFMQNAIILCLLMHHV